MPKKKKMKNTKEWKIPYTRPESPKSLVEAGYPALLAAVLALRGIKDVREADAMIKGGTQYVYDPLLIKDMDKASRRLRHAIEQKETVAVYGDYDVDGITATCLVTDYLCWKGLECTPYIPDRSEEGYGLNCAALDALRAQGVTLVITVDCGITAVAEADYARSIGMDMIITDHHECRPNALPEAVAVADCKQEGDTYPNPYLAGVGMALKLVCACEGNCEDMIERYCDLVAIGTVADVMPLTGENRYFVKKGLEKLEKEPRPGIAAMFRESSLDPKKLSSSSIGYSLAPRLNAAGRLGQAETAARLLMSINEKDATALAVELCELNRKRQNIETEIWEEARSIIEEKGHDNAPIVLASENWHQGVIGIAASRLAEHYSLPSIMICLSGETGKGSCRSYGGFNLFEALSACSEHLIGFGGHALAAGLNIKAEKLDAFREALAEYYRHNRPAAQPEVQCDMLINEPSLLSIENVRSLDLLEPYGNQNPKPVLCMSGVLLENATAVGSGRHLRVRVKLGNSHFEGIFFSRTARELGIREGELVDLAFSPQINDFRGHTSVQLLLSAIRPHDSHSLCQAILEGREPIEYAAARYCPKRADFVKIWRGFTPDFTVGEDTAAVIAQSPDGMEPEKFCLCLMVLLETGLLAGKDKRVFGAKQTNFNGKVDLETTKLIKALRKAGSNL